MGETSFAMQTLVWLGHNLKFQITLRFHMQVCPQINPEFEQLINYDINLQINIHKNLGGPYLMIFKSNEENFI